MELESSELLKRLIQAGVGIGFLPESNVRADVAAGTLRTMRVEGMKVQRELALIYRKDKVLTRAAQAFLEVATMGTPHSSVVALRRKGVNVKRTSE